MNSAEVLIKFKGDTDDSTKAIKEQEQQLDSLKKKGEVAFLGLTAAADAFTASVLGGGVQYNAEIETYLTRLETLTGSAKEANKILDQIKKDALATPFEVSSLTQAESLLLSTGITAEDARKDILALGNAISASGGGNAELSRMAVNLQQIKNVGKASALDIKQFAYAGIDIYGLLADSMGVTREEASKLDVSYEMLSTALQKASNQGGKYYGAMEKQSKTYNGAMSNLSESIQVLKGEFAKGLFKAVKKLIPQLTKMFDWLGENYKIIVAIAAPLLTFLNVVTGFLIIKKVTAGFAAFNAVLAANPIMAIVAAVAALVVGIVYLWNNCEAFRNFWINLWNIIKQVCINIINGIISFFQSIPQTVNNIVNAIIGFINNLPEYLEFVLGFMVGLIVKFFLRLWEFITNDIPNIFAAIVSWLVKFVTQDIPNFINNVIKAIASLPGKIWNVLVDMYNKAKAGITNVFNVIVDTMKKLPGQMLDIGRNIVKGIWDGINGAKDWIGKKIGGFADGIVKGFKKALGIHSPSVIMEKQIGINVGLGVVEGIDDTQKQINETIGGISASMTAGIGSNFSAMGTMQSSNIRPIINVYNNMELDPLGQVVSNVKTFSGGAKNDYNYGVGV
jgi:tape measure domain-containing protein